MLEILLLMFLCKHLRAVLRAKGRPAGWFQLLLVCCWFIGEVMGAIAMVVILRSPGFDATAYLGALLGAAAGAVIVLVIAHSLAPAVPKPLQAFPVVQSEPATPPPPPI